MHRQIRAPLTINSFVLAGPAWNIETCQVRQVVDVIQTTLLAVLGHPNRP